MAKKGFFRRVGEKITSIFKPKKAPTPKPKTPPPPAPRPAPPVGEPLSPERRAQAYIDDLKRRGKEAVYPRDFTAEDWRAFDERGGTP